MDKKIILNRVREAGVVAVIRGPSPELTVKMVEALVKGGVIGIEITYSTPNAADVVKQLDAHFGDSIILGMGTLTEPLQAKEAKKAGARFLVSPVCDPVLGKAMLDSGLMVMIGALTPTEVLQAFKLGSDVVKIFPGSAVGPSYIKALKGPFPAIPLMPTGGVSLANVREWFAAGVFAVGAGIELCPPQLAKEGKFDEISARAREFLEAVQKAKTNLKG
jgi:2-dehydro-3-deoxyphosphogluconate aldolase/(4S)-4-hydroxy-2-oxoglutarate aldolase